VKKHVIGGAGRSSSITGRSDVLMITFDNGAHAFITVEKWKDLPMHWLTRVVSAVPVIKMKMLLH
jgi:hypothetical protein